MVRDIKHREIRIMTDAGRASRPLLIVENQKLLLKKPHIDLLKEKEYNQYRCCPALVVLTAEPFGPAGVPAVLFAVLVALSCGLVYRTCLSITIRSISLRFIHTELLPFSDLSCAAFFASLTLMCCRDNELMPATILVAVI